MLSVKIISLYQRIVTEAERLVAKHVDPKDLTGNINFAAIFSHSYKEYDKYLGDIGKNGRIFEEQPTGDYYKLDEPLKTDFGYITVCRVRKPVTDTDDLGYVDFETTDFTAFKQKYLQRKKFSEITNVLGIDLIELYDPVFRVRAYFPQSFEDS